MVYWDLSVVIPLADMTLYGSPERCADAIRLFKQILDLDPLNDSIWNRFCDIYVNTGKFDKALDASKQALLINPRNRLAWYHLSTAYYNKGLIKYSQKGIKHANMPHCLTCSNDFDFKLARCLLAYAYSKQGSYDKAIEICQGVTRNHSNYIFALVLLGVFYNGKGEYDKAITILKDVLEINPNFNSAWLELGYSYYKNGNLESGLEFLNKVINSKYTSEFLEERIVKVKHELSNNLPTEGLKRPPSKYELITHDDWYKLAQFFHFTENYNEALEACDSCLTLMPDFKKAAKLRKKIVEKSR